MKDVIILRGVSGSGKSTFCNLLRPDAVVCSADHYFYNENGEYVFNARKLHEAHSQCKEKFDFYLENERELIVIDNTNTSEFEHSYYKTKAIEHGYNVTYLVLENRHGNSSVHNVPDEILNIQRNRLLKDIRL